MFAPRLDPLVNNMCFYFSKTEIKSDFKWVFLQLYYKIVHSGLVIILRFCLRKIIHHDETVILYFMPNHEMSKFLYNLKAERCNVNLMNKIQSENNHFGSFICDLKTQILQ